MRKLVLTLILNLQVFGWYFDQSSIKELSDKQLKVVRESILAGDQYQLGVELASLSIVETRAGEIPDRNPNRICGVHQLDTVMLTRKYGSTGNPKRLCKVIEQNTMYSALLAADELLYWYNTVDESVQMAVLRYNRGYLKSKHDKEFLRRFNIVKRELQKAILTGILTRYP